MNVNKVIQSFQSMDRRSIWESIWDILRCNEVDELKELKSHIPNFREALEKVDMSGGFRNYKYTLLAFTYIERMCNGECRCFLYSGPNLFDPVREGEFGFVKVDSKELKQELCEAHFLVTCLDCDRKFFVREVIGGHVPWYEWKNA